jgi:hypothetical protein
VPAGAAAGDLQQPRQHAARCADVAAGGGGAGPS